MKIRKFNESYDDNDVKRVRETNVNFLSPEEKKEYDKMKFKVGDFVRFLKDGKIYQIEIIELFGKDEYPYSVEDYRGSFWRREDELEKLSDYELDAMKYNL